MEQFFESKSESPDQDKWTLAVNLAADLRDPNGQLTGAGTFEKWQSLKAISEKTAQAPVSVVVTLPHADAAARNLLDLEQRSAHATQTIQGAGRQEAPLVDTYLIKDGRIQLLQQHRSSGLDEDVEELLKLAERHAPANNLGLVVMAHGWGTEKGMTGDTGDASPAELRDAIKNGLGSRARLQLLNFDACRMASDDVAGRMKDVTDYMVASADTEAASLPAGFDGQNIANAIEQLIENPDKSGSDLARDLVTQARTGVNGQPTTLVETPGQLRAGTDTLIALNMRQYAKFEESLAELARQLRPQLTSASDRNAIASAIDETAAFPSHVPPVQAELRDTKQFAEKLLEQIREGKLTDLDGGIGRAARAVLDSQNTMTEDLHVNENVQSGIGGMSVFLPVSSAQSRQELVRSRFAIQAIMSDVPQSQTLFSAKPELQHNSAFALSMTSSFLSADQRVYLVELEEAQKDVAQASNQEEYSRAVAAMQREAREFMASPLATRLVRETAMQIRPQNGDYNRSEWAAFVNDLNIHSRRDLSNANK